MEKQKNVFP